MLKKGLCRSEQVALKKLFMKQTPPKTAAKQMRVELPCVLNFYASFADPNISKRKQAASEQKHQQNIHKRKKQQAENAELELKTANATLATANAKVAKVKKSPGEAVPELAINETTDTVDTSVDLDPATGTPEWEALSPQAKGAITRRRNQEETATNPLLD